jgi:hypothetical protein
VATIGFVAVASGVAYLAMMPRSPDAEDRIMELNGSTTGAHSFVIGSALFSFGPVHEVSLLGPRTDDPALDVLDAFPELTTLTLTNTRVTDAGLTRLKRFRNLQYVNYGNVVVSFAGPAGESLNGPPLGGGKGLAELKAQSSLQTLVLTGSGTSDADIDGLSELDQITEIKLVRTRVTADGVARLKRALPGCTVGVR